VVYEAKDTLSGSVVHVFEWAPKQVDSALTDRVKAAEANLADVEIFSDLSTYYFVAEPGRQNSAIPLLQSQGLFTGAWPDLQGTDKEPTPDSKEKEAAIKPSAPRNGNWIWVTAAVFLVAALALGAYAYLGSEKPLTGRHAPDVPQESQKIKVSTSQAPPLVPSTVTKPNEESTAKQQPIKLPSSKARPGSATNRRIKPKDGSDDQPDNGKSRLFNQDRQ
jgi:hypothetical protein